jgi:DNA-binding NarL/FixJ family response regulator
MILAAKARGAAIKPVSDGTDAFRHGTLEPGRLRPGATKAAAMKPDTMRGDAIGSIGAAGPTAALLMDDHLLRLRLECVLDLAPSHAADVLVIDLPAGQLRDGLTPPDARPCLVLSDDPALGDDAGLAGVLPRDASAGQIAAAVAALAEGLSVRGAHGPARPIVTAPLVATPLAATLEHALTPREQQILGLVGGGMSNKTIARRLGISAHTVKYHLEAVFAKLGVRSRAEAATQGLRRGLVG